MPSRHVLLANTARRQRGAFTLAQASASGIPIRTIQSRVAAGIYEAIHPGVYGYSGAEPTWERAVFAAVLSTSAPAAASHQTAAYVWGLTTRRPKSIEVVTNRHQRPKRFDFTVHESKDLLDSDIVEVDGLPVTSAVRTVVDIGASAPRWLVESCLDSGLRTDMFTAWQVRCFIARVARPGRNGVGVVRPLVEDRLAWDSVTESDLEDLFRSVVSRLRFPMPEPQFKLFDTVGDFVGRFDFAYPTRMALIETDSERWHMDSASFRRDREKQNQAHALGWTVYRFTWRQLVDDPDSVRRIIATIWED